MDTLSDIQSICSSSSASWMPSSIAPVSEDQSDRELQIVQDMLNNNNCSFLQSFYSSAQSVSIHSNLEIRDYQREIFENARDKNSIITLETGTGKTLTAVLLMAYYLTKPETCNKKAIFLAPTVPLVDQQATSIRNNIPKIASFVQKYTGKRLDRSKAYIVRVHAKSQPNLQNRTKWKILMKTAGIFAMIPDCFLTCLRKGLMRMSDLSCIVFDECHHTDSDHVYNQIMREFYHHQYKCDQQLPRIIGLTACPICEKEKDQNKISNAMLTICANLDSNFVPFEQKKVARFANDAQIQFLCYEPEVQGQYFIQYLKSKQSNSSELNEVQNQLREQSIPLAKLLERIENFDIFFAQFLTQNNQNQQVSTHQRKDQQLSAGGVSQTLIKIVLVMQKDLKNNIAKLMLEVGLCGVHAMLQDVQKNILNFTRNVITSEQTVENLNFVKELHTFMEELLLIVASGASVDQCNLSAKANLLIEDLKEGVRESKEQNVTVIVIFVYERMTAFYLDTVLKRYVAAHMESKLDSDLIMGHNQSEAGPKKSSGNGRNIIVSDENEFQRLRQDLKQNGTDKLLEGTEESEDQKATDSSKLFHIPYTYYRQVNTVGRFRNKDFRLLISTSVAEEGFDIPVCNIVYSYSNVQSYRQFIQMKGRARHVDSTFTFLTPVPLEDECKQNIDQLQEQNKIVKKTQQYLSTQFDIEKIRRYYQEKIYPNIKQSYLEQYHIEKTGVVLSTFWAHTVINEFEINLRRSMASPNSGKIRIEIIIPYIVKSEKYCALILLPIVLRDYVQFFEMQNLLFTNKSDAKRAAELFTVRRLHQLGYLDDYLTPIFSKRTLNFTNFFDEEDFLAFVSAENKIELQKHCYSVYDQDHRLKSIYRTLGSDELHPAPSDGIFQQKDDFYLYRVQIEGLQYCQLGLLFHNDTLHDYTCQIQLGGKPCKVQLIKEKFTIDSTKYNQIARIDTLFLCWNLEAIDKQRDEHLELLRTGIVEQPQQNRCLKLVAQGNQNLFASRRLNIVFLNETQTDIDWQKIGEIYKDYNNSITQNPILQQQQIQEYQFLIQESANIRDMLNRKKFEAQFSFLFQNDLQINHTNDVRVQATSDILTQDQKKKQILGAIYGVLCDESKRQHHRTLNVGKSLYKLLASVQTWHELNKNLKIYLQLYTRRRRLLHESFIKMQCVVICQLHLYIVKGGEKHNPLQKFLAPTIQVCELDRDKSFEREFSMYRLKDAQNYQQLTNADFSKAFYSILEQLQQLPGDESIKLCSQFLKQLKIINPLTVYKKDSDESFEPALASTQALQNKLIEVYKFKKIQLLQQAITEISYRKCILLNTFKDQSQPSVAQPIQQQQQQQQQQPQRSFKQEKQQHNDFQQQIIQLINQTEKTQIQQLLDRVQLKTAETQLQTQDSLAFLGGGFYEYYIARLIARTPEISSNSSRCKLLHLILCSIPTQAYLCIAKKLHNYLIMDESEQSLKRSLGWLKKQQKAQYQENCPFDAKFYYETIVENKLTFHSIKTAQSTLRALLGAILLDCDFDYAKAEKPVSALLEKEVCHLIHSNFALKFPHSVVFEKWPEAFENCLLKRTDTELYDKPAAKFYALYDGEGKLLHPDQIEAFCKEGAWWRLAEQLKQN